MPKDEHIAEISDPITPDQHTWTFFMFALLVIGLLISSYTTYIQRHVDDEERGRSYIQATAAGYIIAGSAIFGMLPMVLKFKRDALNKAGLFTQQKFNSALNLVIWFPLPYTLTIAILAMAAAVILSYQNQIAQHHVANEFYTWYATFTFLLIIQSFLLFIFSKSGKEPSPLRYVIYLLSVFNAISLGILRTILKFFSTDG
jgi:hypothetical protein